MADDGWLTQLLAQRVAVVDVVRGDQPADLGEGPLRLTIGVGRGGLPAAVPPAVDVLLTDTPSEHPDAVAVADLDAATAELCAALERAPRAALALAALLRQAEALSVPLGLAAESATYSMLLAGPEFARWRANRPIRSVPGDDDPVLVSRTGDVLTVTLNRPHRRNAFGLAIREGLVDALDMARLDDSISAVHLRGAGPSFCSGGDLDEFGTAPDVSTAHVVRLERSAAARVHALRRRTTVFVHGACVGAGAELPAFADRVVAAPDAFFALPEIGMGLIPGAGGTVGLTHRIGRRRTAYLALTGHRLAATEALAWGLVDAVVD